MQKALSDDQKIYDSSVNVTTKNDEGNLEEEMEDEEIDQAA